MCKGPSIPTPPKWFWPGLSMPHYIWCVPHIQFSPSSFSFLPWVAYPYPPPWDVPLSGFYHSSLLPTAPPIPHPTTSSPPFPDWTAAGRGQACADRKQEVVKGRAGQSMRTAQGRGMPKCAHTLHTRAGMGSSRACHPKTRSTSGTAVKTEEFKHVCLLAPMYFG